MEANRVHSEHWRPVGRIVPVVRSTPPEAVPAPAVESPRIAATDPRWVLAVRTAEVMEGPVLPLDKRERLLRIGRILGLTPFDSNLIIAIVQDQARRGVAPGQCPTQGIAQLAMVSQVRPVSKAQRRVSFAATVAALVVAEVFALWWLFQ